MTGFVNIERLSRYCTNLLLSAALLSAVKVEFLLNQECLELSYLVLMQ